MAKEKDETTKTPDVAQGATEVINDPETVHYLDYKASEDTGVIECSDYKFSNYTPGGRDAVLDTDIKHLLATGFNATPYHFVWFTYSKVSECSKRYFTPCRPDIHGKWFKNAAWDQERKAITSGWDYRHNRKELILCVRSANANVEETRQMLALSQEVNDPDKGARAEAAKGQLMDKSEKYVKFVGPGLTQGEHRW